MTDFVINGQDGVDDDISTSWMSSGDKLISSTFGGNDTVTPWSAAYDVRLGEGNDLLNGPSRGGVARGEAGDDQLWVNLWGTGQHTLYGGDGNDDIGVFLGDTGVSDAYGGNGHDLFREQSAVGTISSWDGGDGYDVVTYGSSTPVALTLGATGTAGPATGSSYSSVEGASGTGGADTITGSRVGNLLIGNNGTDILNGADGNDFLIGESRSTDFIQAWRGIKGNFVTENPFSALNSNASGGWADDDGAADSLYGGRGDDVLSGGYGPDRLDGGLGSDWATYLSSGPGGVVANLQTGGTGGQAAGDIYISVENLQGSDFDDTLIGGRGNNILRGERGNDSLEGRGGRDALFGGDFRDTLAGGEGADTLTGGLTEDVFVFGTGALAAADTITDMQVNHDEIWLSRRVFSGVGSAGQDLAASRFVVGTEATERWHRIIHDDTTGSLWFDADGDGDGAAVLFARLSAGLALAASDFVVIA